MKFVDCRIEIKTTPGKIIRAFTDEQMLKDWWGVERSLIELKPGGIYTMACGINDNGIKYISTGVIKDYVPDMKLHIGDYVYINPEQPFLGPLNLKVEATATDNGAMLHLQQGPYPNHKGEHWDWYYNVVNEAWPEVLVKLKKYHEK